MTALCNHCQQILEIVNSEGTRNFCDDCYHRVYFLPQKTAEMSGLLAIQKYHRTKVYIRDCYRPEIIAAVELLLTRLGVPGLTEPK